jgi:hypothetical protein
MSKGEVRFEQEGSSGRGVKVSLRRWRHPFLPSNYIPPTNVEGRVGTYTLLSIVKGLVV